MLNLTFTTDNSAFDGDTRSQMAATLATVAREILAGKSGGRIRDENGNTIGAWDWECLIDEERMAA